jgi:hypothetical protein
MEIWQIELGSTYLHRVRDAINCSPNRNIWNLEGNGKEARQDEVAVLGLGIRSGSDSADYEIVGG